jgi:methionine--tRNA ligase beta chain
LARDSSGVSPLSSQGSGRQVSCGPGRDGEEVVIDFNHPFAGRKLRYWLGVRSVRHPTASEREETAWMVAERRTMRMQENAPARPSRQGGRRQPSPPARGPSARLGRGAEVSVEDVMRRPRVGRVREARVAGTDRLLQLRVEVGSETRSLVAGIAAKYEPESLIGRSIIVVTNLKPARIRGVESRGMLLAAVGEDGKPVIASFDEPIPPGTVVREPHGGLPRFGGAGPGCGGLGCAGLGR